MFVTREDFRQAWRAWRTSLKSGGSTAVVILTFALAVGSCTAMFVLVQALLNVVPYQHPENLVVLWEKIPSTGLSDLRISIPDYQDFASQNHSFSHLGVFAPGTQDVLVGENVERISSAQVGTGFFRVLGVRMLRGRDSNSDDTSAVLLGESFWRSRFSGWADPIGQTIKVDGVDRKIIGIVPSGQQFPTSAELWVPFVPTPELCACKRNGHSYEVIGRLKHGVSVGQADAEVKTIAARIAALYPDSNADVTAWVRPLREELIGEVRPAMWMLGGATGCLLLMGCVSVGAILFAGGVSRGSEIAMRQVLGATRGRVVKQLLLESGFSALTASALGLLLAWWLLRLFLRIVPDSLTEVQAVSIGPWAAVFATVLALVTMTIFSLLPALSTTSSSLLRSIKGGAFAGSPKSSRWTRNGLIVIENTVAFVLLLTSMLLLNSLVRLTNVSPGFQPQGTISADLNLSSQRYSSSQSVISFYASLIERLRALPGVESVAAVNALPMTGSTEGIAYYPIGTYKGKPGEEPLARSSIVTPGYFKTMEITILRGRDFDSSDGEQSHVMMVNETVAHLNWPNDNPVGKHIGVRGGGSRSWEVIGVVSDTKDDGLAAAAPPRIYLNEFEFGEKGMKVVIRATGDLNGLVGPLRREVASLDPSLAVFDFETVQGLVDESLATNRIITRIVSVFSVMSLVLAAVGVYGVVLSTLVRRTWEFGIRIAVGSNLGRIAWLVLREGFMLVMIGIIAGLIVTFASSRLVSSFLFGVAGTDIPSYLMAAAAQLLVVAAGCLVLLRRIAKLDPAAALKKP